MKTSQTQKLLELLLDGQPHSTPDIMEKVYGGSHLGLCRVGARIFEIRKMGYQVVGKKDPENPSLFWYKLVKEAKQEVLAI